MHFDSGGVLKYLPIPFSVIACYVGIVFLGEYKRAYFALLTIFFSFVLMVMATVITSTSSPTIQQAKLILLIQFVLPMFALVLGQMYGPTEKHSLEKTVLYVLVIIIPWQLIATWSRGFPCLYSSLGLFSIYQHLQYVPVVFVSGFLVSLYSLWQSKASRVLLVIMTPMIAIYAAASMSMLAVGILHIGFGFFAFYFWKKGVDKLPTLIFLISILMTVSYLQHAKDIFPNIDCGLTNKFTSQEFEPSQLTTEGLKKLTPAEGRRLSSRLGLTQEELDSLAPEQLRKKLWVEGEKIPTNIMERLEYWNFYFDNITSSPTEFLIGHESVPDRSTYPSAHNYYLDFVYNFGFMALLPLISLLLYTCLKVLQVRKEIWNSSALIGLCLVAFLLLIIDNSLKVSLRQPYPGIFMYFIWGLLLSRLTSKVKGRKADAN